LSQCELRCLLEGGFDLNSIFRRCLKVRERCCRFGFAPGLSLGSGYTTVIFTVDLVPKQYERETTCICRRRLDEKFLLPKVKIVK